LNVVERQPWNTVTVLASWSKPFCTCSGSQGERSSFSANVIPL
jgi:hypothetical protein